MSNIFTLVVDFLGALAAASFGLIAMQNPDPFGVNGLERVLYTVFFGLAVVLLGDLILSIFDRDRRAS